MNHPLHPGALIKYIGRDKEYLVYYVILSYESWGYSNRQFVYQTLRYRTDDPKHGWMKCVRDSETFDSSTYELA